MTLLFLHMEVHDTETKCLFSLTDSGILIRRHAFFLSMWMFMIPADMRWAGHIFHSQ